MIKLRVLKVLYHANDTTTTEKKSRKIKLDTWNVNMIFPDTQSIPEITLSDEIEKNI